MSTTSSQQLSSLKVLFPDWTEEDLLFTLQDANGDLDLAIDLISEGHASQWDQVKTKKSKKEAAAAAASKPAIAEVPVAPAKHNSRTKSSPHRPAKRPSNSWTTPPKKPSYTPSTTRSNQTWASVLQSKPEPEPSFIERESPPAKSISNPFDLTSLSIGSTVADPVKQTPTTANDSLLPPPPNFGLFNPGTSFYGGFFNPQPQYQQTQPQYSSFYPYYSNYPQQQPSAYTQNLFQPDLFQRYKF